MDRFWVKVNKTDDCWWWTGGVSGSGYGGFRVDGRVIGTHRFAWELVNGPIPEGLVIDHLCRNPLCVRPDHMEVVTRGENTRRGAFNRDRKQFCPNGHDTFVVGRRPNNGRCRECHRQDGHHVGSTIHSP